jgi:2',3'-cyclic-nucleotide 2'-phosphodiesterase/3'-nucleotidase
MLAASLTACAACRARLRRLAAALLAVLETTDLHANLLGYDYYKLKADPSIGLERTATLIARAQRIPQPCAAR